MSLPVFYFTSKKDNPKSYITLNIKNENNLPVINFESESNTNLSIDDKIYILDLKYSIRLESNKDPIVGITCNVKPKLSHIKETVDSLVSFMSDFKTKINMDLIEETKKIDDLIIERDMKQKELEQKLIIERDMKKKEEQKLILKDKKYRDLLKIQESFIIYQYNEKVRNEEHVKVMVNNEIEIQNKKQIFDSKDIMSYLKTELDNIELDTKELDSKSIEDHKLQKIKDKYKTEVAPLNNIVEDCLNIEDEIYSHIKNIVCDDPNMVYTNLIYIITELMKFIENFNTEGADKKQIIIKSIKKFLVAENMNCDETDIILDTVCPELIDILLLVDKRKIIIKKKLNCFFPFCS